jgi:ParB family chromosome partitioning protein
VRRGKRVREKPKRFLTGTAALTAARTRRPVALAMACSRCGIGKTLTAYLRRADEGTLSRLLVEATITLAASRTNPAIALRDAATVYKVDTDTVALKTKAEFAAKEKARKNANGSERRSR